MSRAFDILVPRVSERCDIFLLAHKDWDPHFPVLLVRSISALAISMAPLAEGPYHCRDGWETTPLETPERLSIVAGIPFPHLEEVRDYIVAVATSPEEAGGWVAAELDELSWIAALKLFSVLQLN
jgi:hypothetical protein